MQRVRAVLAVSTSQPDTESPHRRIYNLLYISIGITIGILCTKLYILYRLKLQSESNLPLVKFNEDRIHPTIEYRIFQQQMFKLKHSHSQSINNRHLCISKLRSIHKMIVQTYNLNATNISSNTATVTNINGVKCLWYIWPGIGKCHSNIKTHEAQLFPEMQETQKTSKIKSNAFETETETDYDSEFTSNDSNTDYIQYIKQPIKNTNHTNTNFNANLYCTEHTDNGVIICCHGGQYIQGSADSIANFCCTLSRLTNMRCLSIDYRLAPENPLPYAVNDIIKVYQYMLSYVQSSYEIILCGNGSGAGLILLAMQQIIKDNQSIAHMHRSSGRGYDQNQIPLPLCCILISPYVHINGCSWTLSMNERFDCMLNFMKNGFFGKGKKQIFGEYIVGNWDKNGNERKKKSNLKSAKYNACFGSFRDFCDVFFMVGQTEILLNDTLLCVKECRKELVDCELEIHPYLCHSYPVFCGVFPEANEACVRIAMYIKREQMKYCDRI